MRIEDITEEAAELAETIRIDPLVNCVVVKDLLLWSVTNCFYISFHGIPNSSLNLPTNNTLIITNTIIKLTIQPLINMRKLGTLTTGPRTMWLQMWMLLFRKWKGKEKLTVVNGQSLPISHIGKTLIKSNIVFHALLLSQTLPSA